MKDTVPTHEEDDEVDADKNARHGRAAMSHDTIIHHSIPVFTCQDLCGQEVRFHRDTDKVNKQLQLALNNIRSLTRNCVQVRKGLFSAGQYGKMNPNMIYLSKTRREN